MPRVAPSALPALLVACAGGCSAPLDWDRPQDPAPSGPGYLRRYKESHFRALGAHFRGGLTGDTFHARLADARVLYLGDHHADVHLHARMLDLLAELDQAGIDYHLGLECIGVQDEPAVGRFLAGECDLDALVAELRARWSDTWLAADDVDSAFYRELLLHARRRRRPAFALEPTPRLPLFERDQVIARTVLRRARQHPHALVVVVIGETHLLGFGQLVKRVGLPHVAIGANLSTALRASAARTTFTAEHRFAESESGVLFALPFEPAP